MEEYFSNRAQEAIRSAQEFAREFGSANIGTEHILLGLARDRGSIAARALEKSALSFDKLYAAVKTMTAAKPGAAGAVIEFSPKAKNAIRRGLGPGDERRGGRLRTFVDRAPH
jgi:ATP-dependent Clp protease ATP-binding subunit ClpC